MQEKANSLINNIKAFLLRFEFIKEWQFNNRHPNAIELKKHKYAKAKKGIQISLAQQLDTNLNRISGGKVKLLHLKKHFKTDDFHYNILYLTSSSLPMFYEIWKKKTKEINAIFVLNFNGVAYSAWAGNMSDEINKPFIYLLKKSDYIIFQSLFSKISVENILKIHSKNYSIIHNCVNTEDFKPLDNKSYDKQIKLLISGTHSYAERISIPVLATKYLINQGIDAKLIIAGFINLSEKENNSIQILINENSLQANIEFIGTYSQTEAPAIYQQADIFLHMQHNDVCPIVVLEAMSCGLPVIASESGGTPELVGQAGICLSVQQSWTTYYYPSVKDVANAVITIAGNITYWSKLARERAVSKFSVDKWCFEHRQIFNHLLK